MVPITPSFLYTDVKIEMNFLEQVIGHCIHLQTFCIGLFGVSYFDIDDMSNSLLQTVDKRHHLVNAVTVLFTIFFTAFQLFQWI